MSPSGNAPIDFYFDFSSPYGYFGSCRIDAVAERHGRDDAPRGASAEVEAPGDLERGAEVDHEEAR